MTAPGEAARRKPARRPTIKDIARRAGVSESAVSFALNDRPGVSQDTRARVRRVAEELGWQANSAARALSGERAGAMGLVLARPAQTLGVESFFLQLVSGIQEVLSARQIALLFQVVEDLDTECALYRRWWAERRVDGVLVVDPRTDDPRPELLAALGLPAVVVGGPAAPGPDPAEPSAGEPSATEPSATEPSATEPSATESATTEPSATEPSATPPHPLLSTVWADDAKAMARILDHLYGLGHRRIVHIAGLPGLAHTARRIQSLRTEADRRGLDRRQVHSVTTDYSDAEGAEATRRLLDAARPPTAIVYDNDVMAVAGASVAAERGIPVPDALSIVAWDDSALCRVTHPRLTALVRDTPGFGRLAAQELLAVLDGGPLRTVQGELPHLEARESTATPSPG
ncbi:transcriptional regulator, LacI family [Streptomyces sp. SceaMP-e96]|uniref:LacI family DNA-binding transcriptional regulator n=1 Tax=unclassified Streptomyces TaxID=2593676 RepID=UPI000823BD76|nr:MULTISPECIES: LacI family DNA-binding transcriptional regulator [unclassified Streptomyces]MYT15071.1 substrate-binding domain-containing protein [Streptomyces sp. SID4951]SCK18805.1 transcriptional regulator, LacI family [Streptomyces sp. SceaMP-e96]